MIVLITSRRRGKTVQSLARGAFGVPTPRILTTHYERLFRAWYVPRATYIFSDFERLHPWELQLAAELYRAMKTAGLRCLNDPSLVMSRVELLTALERRGINPFGAYRGDEQPTPRRFPVFIRDEMGHSKPAPDLYGDQEALEAALHGMQARGVPLRGLLVVELAAEPYAEGLWAKWGTWRIGDETIVEHIAVDGTWLVKVGDHARVTPQVALDEHDGVLANRHASALAPVFDLAHFEYGRADHGQFRGRPVIYEINSNPYIGPYVPDANPLRRETQRFARQRIAEALAAIDTPSGGLVRLPEWRSRRPWRWARPRLGGPGRP
jgi:hypothetical protein